MSDQLSVPGNRPVLEPAKPGTVMDGPRLVVCYECATMTKVAPYTGPVELDHELLKCVSDHQHLEMGPHEVHMQMFPTTQETWEQLDPVEQIRKDAAANGLWIQEYRSQVSEDAVKCHRSHNQPAYPGTPCIDYKTQAKRLGGGLSVRVNPALRDPAKLQYLCTYCPYESTVTTAKRIIRGDYKL